MGITNSNKELSTNHIHCGDSFTVTLSLTAAPDILSSPTDIVLILDRSQSMAGRPLANLKNGAKKFIDILDETTDSSMDGHIGGGSHIGIVSFSTTAVQNTSLITSVADLKAAVDALSADGFTNHADAFTKARGLFDPTSANDKVMVMFTDGETTTGGNAAPVAEAAKAAGITIYIIGLSGSGGLDLPALNSWASSPASSYVAITPNDEELEALFENLAGNITKPGATDIVLTDTISSCFKITALSSPTKGTASLLNSNTLRWTIKELGVKKSEGAVLEFTVQHNGLCSGTLKVNDSITYADKEGNSASFPDPEIDVDCEVIIVPESCPEPVKITFEGCQDAIEFNAGDVELESLGRILQLNVTLKNICPHKRVALAIVLTELDDKGKEWKRGFKTITVPAHNRSGCQNVTVRCIKFVLPEDLDPSGNTKAICNPRQFHARFFANYVDSDFECWGELR